MEKVELGLYERLLDEELGALLDSRPELRPILRSLDTESAPHIYTQFLGQLVNRALRITHPESRVSLLNRLIDLLSSVDELSFLSRRRLLNAERPLLVELQSREAPAPRPQTPLSISALLTGQGADPPLEHELRIEMMTADRVDILVSFIKWSGLRLLLPAFERLRDLGIPVRILSTSYMGASDPAALEWLAGQGNIAVKVSFDTGATRLHAKAYHFVRKTGYSTAYIGSANMSHSAMTQGLEWTVKVTEQDMPHILARFGAEFSAYWESPEFEPFHEADFLRFRQAIQRHRDKSSAGASFLAEITPRPFQLRILEALAAARQRGQVRNLVVAATGTGKTVVSALDYQSFSAARRSRPPLLYVAHRKEILEQARSCFRTVLHDQNFGELLVDGQEPTDWSHVFASVQSLNSRRPWSIYGESFFKFLIVDEAHHGTAASYRPLLTELRPEILLGLTATPERMDGSSILNDFGNEYAAEIRLPEALEEKLLCPFHYFGVTDSIDLSDERFWRDGRYDVAELDRVLSLGDLRAEERARTIIEALNRYQPDLSGVRGIGFCAGVRHAIFMAKSFNAAGIASEVITGDVDTDQRNDRLSAFRSGKLVFLFTVDVLSEGVDVPETNLVLFLRPTESLTVFLQQLGRGLRHAPGKDCLTVLDFVGLTHRKYRMDAKLSALLSRRRQRIDRELEADFPHLPPGCSIQLERVARERVLQKIKQVLNSLSHFVPEAIGTWEAEVGGPLTFARFISETGLSPIELLSGKTWTEWKNLSAGLPRPSDPDLLQARKALCRLTLRTDPTLLQAIKNLAVSEEPPEYPAAEATALHYLFWGQTGDKVGVNTSSQTLKKWSRNVTAAGDAAEIADWRLASQDILLKDLELPFSSFLKLHATYGFAELKAALGLASIQKPGPMAVGVLVAEELRTYANLVTLRKDEKDFSPTTRYRDYPISPNLLHWESPSRTAQDSAMGKNLIHFQELGYTVLFFARLDKRIDGETSPFFFLGPAKRLVSYEGERPISMVWELEHAMPAALFEEARPA